MIFLKDYRWAGLLLIIGAVSVVLVPPLERLYRSEEGLPGLLFTIWFFCNTVGMIGLSFFYSYLGNKQAAWMNFFGLVCLYGFWIMSFAERDILENVAWIGIGLAFILFAVSATLSKKIPHWVVIVWLLAGVSSFIYQILPKKDIFEYIFNWWNLGLGAASFGAGLALLRQPQKEKDS